MITKTWYDPCPQCGGEITDFDYEVESVRENPDSVISIPNPACPYDADDPDSPDCICIAIPNFAPNPALDQLIPIGAVFTMRPCGDVLRAPSGSGGKLGGKMAGWKMYQQEIPEPGSLGELMQDWAPGAGDLP